MSEHLQVILASGPSEPKRLMLGLAMAAAAASSGTIVHMFLVMDGAGCLRSEMCHQELLKGYPPVSELLSVIAQSGGVVEYCPHCLPDGCDASFARPAQQSGTCGCAGIPAGLASYGVRLSSIPSVVF
ncbi:MAG: DsrE family protein [Bryobacteraceae bacterium]|nr:DsrE family protein [Bryobacteraceae bacterium]